MGIAAVNKAMYIDTHRQLRDAVRRKHLKKWGTYIWFLLHDNAPAHQLVLVKDFLAENNSDNTGPSPIFS
jgi:hypothetical protein